ncbi:unnamed protein product [Pleuronectes platessa]|uniref:Zinc finger protein 541 n=1 Tax=Pleuronectes platessa TaxID=8262 RepID=A0A9N7U822_PLEPL|nr:unnamed protein product [Pleuronectes platessa]
MKSSQPENNTKVLDNSRLLCTVCKRDFRSLPALNGHMRSHSCSKKGEVPPVRRSVSVVMPVSVPVQSRAASKACRAGQRRSSRSSPATGGAVLYRSLMHLEEQEVVTRGSAAAREVEGHYTPPPMLCPVRAGPGLYCSVTTRRQRRAPTVQLHSSNNGLSDLVAMETPATEINKPRINVGRGFQAEVPPLGNHKYAHSDSQNALWLWTPCDELEKPVNQQRVTTLLTMARSSVVPGGGASPEYALTVLSESAGDFLLTLEKLLSTPESSDQSRADVTWSAAETTALVKSLRLHRKDFSRVQRAVQTKSVSQCVEFYYLWKKHLSLRARPPAGLTVTLPETKVRSSSDHGDERDPERPSAPDRRRSFCLKPGAERRRRNSATAEEEGGMGQQEEKKKEEEEEGAASPPGKKQKSSKEVYFSVLPDKYEPLIEEEERETPEERRKRKEEKKRKKQRKYKKYRKNIGKGLRFSWSCLLIGLQNMASVYTTPVSAASTVVTLVNSGAGSRP